MKRLFIFFGITAGVLAPLSARADSKPPKKVPAAQVSGKSPTRQTAAAQAKDNGPRYYVSNIYVTGSNIPLVFYRYNGRWYPQNGPANLSTYGRSSLAVTGYSDVGSALRTLDPSIH